MYTVQYTLYIIQYTMYGLLLVLMFTYTPAMLCRLIVFGQYRIRLTESELCKCCVYNKYCTFYCFRNVHFDGTLYTSTLYIIVYTSTLYIVMHTSTLYI